MLVLCQPILKSFTLIVHYSIRCVVYRTSKVLTLVSAVATLASATTIAQAKNQKESEMKTDEKKRTNDKVSSSQTVSARRGLKTQLKGHIS